MDGTAASRLVGGVLATAASLAVAVLPSSTVEAGAAEAALVPASAATAPRGDLTAVRGEPGDGGNVTFEVVPAQPTPSPTQPAPAPTQPEPTRTGGELPVTGSGSSAVGPLALLGLALLVVGWALARRRRAGYAGR